MPQAIPRAAHERGVGIRVPILLGPTATRKSEVAFELACLLDGEILSADSRAVYRGLDIGTAKPSAAQRARVPHHLIDIREPTQVYDVRQFRDDVDALLRGLSRRGRQPIIVGGSTLYVEALTVGLFEGPEAGADPELRAELEATDLDTLYERLKRVDPETAARVHPHDRLRITRALEVYERTGRPIRALRREARPLSYRFLKVGLRIERKALYGRINRRVDRMIEEGLIEEARRLHPRLTDDLPAYKTIGYQELFAHFEGRCSLEEAIEKIKQHTRNYAKRQMTWYRRYPDVTWVEAADRSPKEIAEEVRRRLGL